MLVCGPKSTAEVVAKGANDSVPKRGKKGEEDKKNDRKINEGVIASRGHQFILILKSTKN